MITVQALSTPPNVSQEERRRHPRVRASLQIESRPEGTDVPMRLETTDISLGGCYVEMVLTLDVGARLDISLWLGEQKVITKGVVVTRHAQFGNGIEFMGMSPQDQNLLRRFLDSLDPLVQPTRRPFDLADGSAGQPYRQAKTDDFWQTQAVSMAGIDSASTTGGVQEEEAGLVIGPNGK